MSEVAADMTGEEIRAPEDWYANVDLKIEQVDE